MFAYNVTPYVDTGFIPNECLLVTNHGECKGIAGRFPYPVRLLIVIAITGYSIYIGIKSGLEYNEENKLKIKNKKWLENYQKENNIIPIKKRSEK